MQIMRAKIGKHRNIGNVAGQVSSKDEAVENLGCFF